MTEGGPPQDRDFEEPCYWPGEHLGAGCPFPRQGRGRKEIFQARAFPPASLLFLAGILSHTPRLLPDAQPPISGACAPGPGWGWSQGEGLVSSSSCPSALTSAGSLQPPPGARCCEEEGHPPGQCHMLSRPKSPLRVPGAGRPSPALALAALAAPPAPAPPRPAGGRDLALLGSFR